MGECKSAIHTSKSNAEKFCKIVHANIFDPNLVYTYMDAITEYDNILVFNGQALIIEDISGGGEWKKKFLYKLITPSYPTELLWNPRNAEISKAVPAFCVSIHEILSLNIDEISGCFSGGSVEEETKCIEKLYLLASEPLNMLLYSLVFLPGEYRKSIVNDIALSLNVSNAELLKVMRYFGSKFCKEIELKKRILSLNIKEILALIPAGVKKYRLQSIVKTTCNICKVLGCNIVNLIISKEVKKRFPQIVEECKRIVDSRKQCLTVEYKCLELEDLSKLVDIARKGSMKLVMVLGDYSKKILRELVNLQNLYIMVVPEVAYIPVNLCRKEGQRIVQAFGGYLSECFTGLHLNNIWKILVAKTVIIQPSIPR